MLVLRQAISFNQYSYIPQKKLNTLEDIKTTV